jgi:disease resistance protein RPM1
MPNLLTLSLRKNACVAERLQFHFQDGWFKSLKELVITNLICLDCILIDEGALPSLETLELYSIPKLDELPIGIQHLKKLKDLRIPSTAYYGGVFFLTEYNNYVIFNTNSLLLIPYLLFF